MTLCLRSLRSFAWRPTAACCLVTLVAASMLGAQIPARSLGPIEGRGIGYIDPSGRELLKNELAGGYSPYVVGRSFHDGFAGVRRADGSWTWIGTNGQAITAARFHTVSDFVDGFAFASPMDDTTRVVSVDARGRVRDLKVPNGLVPRRSRYAIFREPNAQGTMRRGFVSPTGERITAPEFSATGVFLNGRGVARRGTNDPIVLFDEFGKIVAETGMYAKTFVTFADNRLPVSELAGGPLGYVDSTGKFVVPPTFTEATGFGEERAAVRRPGSAGWNVIRPDGENAFAGEFKSAPDFYKGYARVTRVGEDTTMLVDRNGKSPKASRRDARMVGSNGLVYRTPDKKISYVTLDGKEVLTTATLRGKNIATAGEPFFEGFSLISYRPPANAASDDLEGDDGPPAAGTGAAAGGAMTKFMWYELRASMGSIMGRSTDAKRFSVYWGTVDAPANTPVGNLTALFPARPRETLSPTRRIDAVALQPGEEPDIETILIRRNRADFSIVRRGGKDRIDDNVRYTLLEAGKPAGR